MAGFANQIVEIFSTDIGRAVLVIAGLAFLGLFIAVFWDMLSLPKKDVTETQAAASPPPLLSPRLVKRAGEGGWDEGRTTALRNMFLGLVAVGVVAVGGWAVSTSGTKGDVASAGQHGAASGVGMHHVASGSGTGVAAVRVGLQNPADDTVWGGASARKTSDFCEQSGSVRDRYVELCANGSATRMELVRLRLDDRYVLGEQWLDKVPTVVSSLSHATPFTFTEDLSFDAPLTTATDTYDALLVIAVAEQTRSETAAAREEALISFAERLLCGDEKTPCAASDNVFSARARFCIPSIKDDQAQHLCVPAEEALAERKARHGSSAELPSEFLSAPAPIVVGITVDPRSPNPMADMRAASACFVDRYGAALNFRAASKVTGGGLPVWSALDEVNLNCTPNQSVVGR